MIIAPTEIDTLKKHNLEFLNELNHVMKGQNFRHSDFFKWISGDVDIGVDALKGFYLYVPQSTIV